MDTPRRLAGAAAFFSVVCMLSCSSSSSDDNPGAPSGPTTEQIEELEAITESVGSYRAAGAALAAVMDTAAAIDSLASLIAADPAVAWTANNGTGVNIQWASGYRGIVVLRLRNGDGPGGGVGKTGAAGGEVRAGKGAVSGEYSIPSGRNSVLFAPAWSEFERDDSEYADSASKYLPMRGYGAPAVWKDEQVTLAALETMGSGAYGVVRISSHGAPWPSASDIQEVYVISGEVPTKLADSLHFQDLENGDLAIGSYAGGNRYFIAADYLASRVRFGESKPLIINAFCFGGLGGWMEKIRNQSNAGAVLGWDWEVVSITGMAYDINLLRALCDTNSAEPKTVQAWHQENQPSYTEYESDGSESVVSLLYTAADSFALWNPLMITSITPAEASPGSTVVVQGVGFGGEEGAVAFGFAPATGIHFWSPASITLDVPENAYVGENQVTVTTAEGERSAGFPFRVVDPEQENLWSWIYDAASLTVAVEAAHVFDQPPSAVAFSYILAPMEWDGTSFAHTTHRHEGTDTEYESFYLAFHGSLAADGRTLDVEYTRADTSAGSWWRNLRYEHVELTGLPFFERTGELVKYRITGETAAAVVTNLEYHEYVWTDFGGVTTDNRYRSTDWQSSESPPYVSAYFW